MHEITDILAKIHIFNCTPSVFPNEMKRRQVRRYVEYNSSKNLNFWRKVTDFMYYLASLDLILDLI